jgi:hypothetical protein
VRARIARGEDAELGAEDRHNEAAKAGAVRIGERLRSDAKHPGDDEIAPYPLLNRTARRQRWRAVRSRVASFVRGPARRVAHVDRLDARRSPCGARYRALRRRCPDSHSREARKSS